MAGMGDRLIILHYDCSQALVRCITLEGHTLGRVKILENWGLSNKRFHLADSSVMDISPKPFHILHGELAEWHANIAQTWQKFTKVICKANESSDAGYISWC